MLQSVDDDLDVGVGEEVVGAGGGVVGVGRLEEAGRLHDAVLGEFVDDEVDESDLVGGEPGAVEVVLEGLDGGGAVEADEVADEDAKTAALLGGPGDVDLLAAGGGALELDTSFSGDGKWDGRVEHNATFFDVLRQGADRFVAVGSSWLPDQTQKILLARFLLDGSLDTTFGGTGTGLFTEDLPGTWWERATRVVPQNGRLVLGGIADFHFGVRAIGLVRRTSDLIFQGGFEQLNPPDWQVGP